MWNQPKFGSFPTMNSRFFWNFNHIFHHVSIDKIPNIRCLFPKLWKLRPFKDLMVASNFRALFVTSNFFYLQKPITFEPDQLEIIFAVFCSEWLMHLDALVLAVVTVIGGFLEGFKSAISLRSKSLFSILFSHHHLCNFQLAHTCDQSWFISPGWIKFSKSDGSVGYLRNSWFKVHLIALTTLLLMVYNTLWCSEAF